MTRSVTEVRNKNCKDCELYKQAEFRCLTGYGKVPAKIMLVGEAPGFREDDSGRPFVGKAGRVLDLILKELDISRDQIYISNVVHCRPPLNATPKMHHIRTCRKYLLAEIKVVKPRIIITLGNTAIKGLLDNNNRSVAKERGRWIEFEGKQVIATYHPAAALRTSYYAKLIYEDIKRGLKQGEKCPNRAVASPLISYQRVTSLNRLRVLKQLEESEILSVDVETTGTDPFSKKQELICVGLSAEPGKAYVFKNTSGNMKRVEKLLNSAELVAGHNIKFDLKWLRRYGIRVRRPLFDTMVAMHLLDENYPDKSLKHLSRRYLDVSFSHSLDKAEQVILEHRKAKTSPSMKEWVNYNGGDCDATRQLTGLFISKINEQELYPLMKQEMRVLKVLTEMEYFGIAIDRREQKSLQNHYSKLMEDTSSKICRVIGKVNLNSYKQMTEKLFGELKFPILKVTDSKTPSLDEGALQELLKSAELTKERKILVKDLLSYRGYSKLYTTYLKGLDTKQLIKHDGKIHCNFKITGTVTGRLSCVKPNLQQIPREGEIKKMFVSSFKKGRIIQIDYSQAELRILAHYANDHKLITAFQSGRDIHREVAAKVFKVEYENVTKQQRKAAKTVNFGIIYLISGYGLGQKLDCSTRKAQRYIDEWFHEFSLSRRWIKNMEKEIVREGRVSSPLGRIRRLSGANMQSKEGREKIRRGVNSPIQGLVGDITKRSMTKLHHKLRKGGLYARVVGNVHDAVLVDCSREEVKEIFKLTQEIFLNPPLELRVPLEVEFKVGKNWGELEVYDG